MIFKGVILSVFLFNHFALYAQSEEYKVGDTVFVWADNGLFLRKEADFNAASLTKLNYGERIIIQEIDNKDFEYEIINSIKYNNLELPKFKVWGHFLKINYKGTEGFIHSALLSKLHPLKQDEGLEKYLGRVFGQFKITSDIKRINSEYKFKRIIYKNGAIFQQEQGIENNWNYLYFLPDINLREGYLLINKITGFEKNYKMAISETSTWLQIQPVKFETHEIILQSGPFEETRLELRHNYIIVTQEGGN